MTRVDFYVLPVSEPHGRLSFACRLAEKAWRGGHQVYLHSDDEEAARSLDDLLWSFRDTSFVPHALQPAASTTPVLIGSGDDPGAHHDVLINLGGAIPEFFSRFERVAEIVLNDPASLQASRVRWSFYKDRGYLLEHHDMQHMRSAGE